MSGDREAGCEGALHIQITPAGEHFNDWESTWFIHGGEETGKGASISTNH